ncbi:MAG: hypothetical protein A2487_11500 [Candidatus Raymondbacteria bacterium RifOxyC12_full_50_8]|nr:MAG: hypothetical protein A2487_11500 [Candidatus Raymondbacteria bacterium RifOxyC12_full_50_8]OGK02735.1 MAG: hypothetical protein A2350_07190 [Candidatus Raymondbacteria bacterium RifOxyB12_full_50_8]
MEQLKTPTHNKFIYANPALDVKKQFGSVLILECPPEAAAAFGYAIEEYTMNVMAMVLSDPQKGLAALKEMYFDCLVCNMDKPELMGEKIIHEYQTRISPTSCAIACTADMKNEDLWKDLCAPDCVYHRPDKLDAQRLKEFAKMIEMGIDMAHQRRIEALGYDIDKDL